MNRQRVVIDLKCNAKGCHFIQSLDVTGRSLDKIFLLIVLYLCPDHAEEVVEDLFFDGLE